MCYIVINKDFKSDTGVEHNKMGTGTSTDIASDPCRDAGTSKGDSGTDTGTNFDNDTAIEQTEDTLYTFSS
jgi:hypothetical protein